QLADRGPDTQSKSDVKLNRSNPVCVCVHELSPLIVQVFVRMPSGSLLDGNQHRNGQFGRLAKSAGFRRNPQQHAGTGANRQEKTPMSRYPNPVRKINHNLSASIGTADKEKQAVKA
ncbi:hypothetical protein, partial [Comamonas jiangduensis]